MPKAAWLETMRLPARGPTRRDGRESSAAAKGSFWFGHGVIGCLWHCGAVLFGRMSRPGRYPPTSLRSMPGASLRHARNNVHNRRRLCSSHGRSRQACNLARAARTASALPPLIRPLHENAPSHAFFRAKLLSAYRGRFRVNGLRPHS